jgi:regulator of protease activity HflC (stomatin/prohibitin superfamily)
MPSDGQEAETSQQQQQQVPYAQASAGDPPGQLPFPSAQQQASSPADADAYAPPAQGVSGTTAPADNQAETDLQAAPVQQTPPAAARPAIQRLFSQFLSLILIPLVFGAVTCIIILPLLSIGRAHLPYAAFWPIILVVLAIAIAQGLALYYSGENTSLWMLSNVGAFFLFLLVITFSIFGLLPGIILFVVLLITSIVIIRRYSVPVPEGFVAIVFAFGKYSRTLEAGFNLILPWEKIVRELSITETTWDCPPQRIQMSHTEDVVLRCTISYQLLPGEAHLAITQVKDWETSLYNVCFTAIQTIATTFSPDDLIVWQQGLHSRPAPAADLAVPPERQARWEKINTYLFEYIQDRVADWGIQINWVRIHDIVLTPHAAPVLEEALVTESNGSTAAMPAEPVVQQANIPPQSAAFGAGPQVASARSPIQPPPVAAKTAPPRARAFVLPPTVKDEDLEKLLARAYKEVRDERITDPETIRSIASTFAAVAQDPVKSQLVSFDLDRAIRNLLMQAERCEQRYTATGIYNDDTHPDWPPRRPSDENLMAGG